MTQQEPSGHTRPWAAQPDLSDEAVREATGRGWEEWRELIDATLGEDDGHPAIVATLRDEHGVDGWWAQTVAVGYARITGRRLPYQRADGTFSAGKSRTVTVDADELRRRLLDADERAELLPGLDAELRSRPTSKNVRLGIGEGTVELALAPQGDGRVKVTVEHARLSSPEDVEQWKDHWTAWLAALDEA